MKFENGVFNKIINLIDKSLVEGKEIGAQLCKDNDKVDIGKIFEGTYRGVRFEYKDMLKCDKGEFVGDLHCETIPHFPPFPSDVDIKQNFDFIRLGIIKKPFESCVCSGKLESKAKEGELPKKGKVLMGCFCETWHPWSKEEHEKIVDAIEKWLSIPLGFGWFGAYNEIKKLGHIKNKQLQWVEIPIEDEKIRYDKITRHHKLLEERI
jgi:hypothetical protein